MAKLKDATRDQHQNLENVVNVMNKLFDKKDYENLISKFYQFYSSIEPLIPADELSAAGFNFELRRKTQLLETDLAALGRADIIASHKGIWNEVPPTDTAAKAFGACYVMEGATLGGQVIMRHLKQHLDISVENGGSFFNSYGERVGPMWKEFCSILTAFAENNGADDEIVESAKQIFDSFARCFSKSSVAVA